MRVRPAGDHLSGRGRGHSPAPEPHTDSGTGRSARRAVSTPARQATRAAWRRVSTLVSTLLGLLIAVIPTVVLASQISGFVLSVPWWQLGVLAAAT